MPRPASTLDQMAIWNVASRMTGVWLVFFHVLVYHVSFGFGEGKDVQRKSGS